MLLFGELVEYLIDQSTFPCFPFHTEQETHRHSLTSGFCRKWRRVQSGKNPHPHVCSSVKMTYDMLWHACWFLCCFSAQKNQPMGDNLGYVNVWWTVSPDIKSLIDNESNKYFTAWFGTIQQIVLHTVAVLVNQKVRAVLVVSWIVRSDSLESLRATFLHLFGRRC